MNFLNCVWMHMILCLRLLLVMHVVNGYLICPAGSWCSAVNNCQPCPVGFYCVDPNGYGCVSENDARQSLSSQRLICPAGSCCPAGSTVPFTFSPGFYCPASGIVSICPPGSYCPGNGMTTRFTCPPGVYGVSSGLKDPNCDGTCYPGYYCYANSTSPTQNKCPAGSFCKDGILNLCFPGYYCPDWWTIPGGLALSSNPIPCPAGKYSNAAGLTSPCTADCASGNYCPPASTSSEQFPWQVCPIGTYCPTGVGVPIPCPPGTYGNSKGLSLISCSGSCAKGYYCPAGSSSASDPNQLCPAGVYSDGAGSSSASCSGLCQKGYYCPQGSAVPTNTICPPGYYCPTGSQLGTSNPCPAGSFCSVGSGAPTPCSPGRYGSSLLSSDPSCSGQCPAGHYCPLGSSSPFNNSCGIGSYSTAGSSSCSLCPSGKFSLQEGSPSCSECSSGSTSVEGASSCFTTSAQAAASIAVTIGSSIGATIVLAIVGFFVKYALEQKFSRQKSWAFYPAANAVVNSLQLNLPNPDHADAKVSRDFIQLVDFIFTSVDKARPDLSLSLLVGTEWNDFMVSFVEGFRKNLDLTRSNYELWGYCGLDLYDISIINLKADSNRIVSDILNLLKNGISKSGEVFVDTGDSTQLLPNRVRKASTPVSLKESLL